MIQIRKTTPQDHYQLSAIWLESSLLAHDFIPEQYWKRNQKVMEEQYLPLAEVYVAEEKGIPVGFIALMDRHLAAIFVSPGRQGKGIGSLLLQHVKTLRPTLELKVYQKNDKSVGFYQSKGFEIVSQSIDPPTGENEWVMQWKSNSL